MNGSGDEKQVHPAPPGPAARRWLWTAAAFLIAITAVLPGCDPCFGVSTCDGPVLAYDGLVIDEQAESVAGVEVIFVRTRGVALAQDSTAAVTDASGIYRIRVAAQEAGEVFGDFTIRRDASVRGYEIPDIRLVTTRGGNVLSLPSWRSLPGMTYVAELFFHANAAPVAGAEVEFRRVSGIALEEDTLVATTNADGRFWLTPRPLEIGDLIGEMLVRVPGADTVYLIPDLRLATDPEVGSVRILRVGTGPNWWYVASVRSVETGEPVGGVLVEFTRTDGPSLASESFGGVTNADGLVALRPVVADPLARGILTGDVVLTPPAPYAQVAIPGVSLPSFDATGERFLAEWEIGVADPDA